MKVQPTDVFKCWTLCLFFNIR